MATSPGFDTDAQGNVESFLLGRWGLETTLAYPGATSTQALGVNDSDEVVGVYTNADMQHARLHLDARARLRDRG